MSRIPPHTHLHPGRNIYLTSWFILSVLFLTGGETPVVPTSVWDPPSQGLHPGRNVYLTSWVILSVLFLTGGETSVVPTHVQDPPSHGLDLLTLVCVVFEECLPDSRAGSFCLCCF